MIIINPMFNKRLSVSGNVDAIMQEMNKEENAHLKKLSFTKISQGTICGLESFGILSNLRSSLKVLLVGGFIHLGDAQIIAGCITDAALIKLELRGYMGYDALGTIMGSINSSSLQKLILKNQNIDANVAWIISNTIKNSCLVEIAFIGCGFRSELVGGIVASIRDSTIRTLILIRGYLYEQDIIGIIDCIENSRLTKLSLRNASFEYDVRNSNRTFSIVGAVQKTSLKTLDVRGSPFCNRAKDIIDIIKFSPVTKFKFDQICFNVRDSMEIIDAMKDRIDFRTISMRYANVTSDLITKLYDLLENSAATQLDLSGVCLSGIQSVTIINLVRASSITSLNFEIDSVDMDDATTFAMCNLLEGCNIERIKMHKLRGITMDALMESIKGSSLTKFQMNDWSFISKTVRSAIKEILKDRRGMANSSYKTKSARTLNILDRVNIGQ